MNIIIRFFVSLILVLNVFNTKLLAQEPVYNAENQPLVRKKAVLVGIDGLQFEQISKHNTPNFDRLVIHKAYTGGIDNFSSEQNTFSGPGWATVLTGVWANKHKVKRNGSGHAEFPSIFMRIHQHDHDLKTASIVHWRNLNTSFFKNEMSTVAYVESDLTDQQVTDVTVDKIQKGADFIFAHLDDVDHTGHEKGFGKDYSQSLLIADKQLGRILDAIKISQIESSTSWLVIITTDHGRELSGFGHSKQTLEEKTIFIGSNIPMNEESLQPLKTSNNDFQGLYAYPAQTSIVPTILTWLDIPIDPFWLLEGPSLIGGLTIRKVMPGKDATLGWFSAFEGGAEIYKDRALVATVDAVKGEWSDPNPPSNDPVDYSIIIDGQSLSYRSKDYRGIRRLLKWHVLDRIRRALNIAL